MILSSLHLKWLLALLLHGVDIPGDLEIYPFNYLLRIIEVHIKFLVSSSVRRWKYERNDRIEHKPAEQTWDCISKCHSQSRLAVVSYQRKR